jgi:hypothetical protein
MKPTTTACNNRGYTLPDILIASLILGVGIMAASSLAFSLNTQEELAARVGRGTTMVENAAMLYGLGLDASAVLKLIPTDPHITLTAGSESLETGSGDLSLRWAEFTVTINTVDDVGSWSPGSWTGGGDLAAPRQRTLTVRAYRSSHQLRNDQ